MTSPSPSRPLTLDVPKLPTPELAQSTNLESAHIQRRGPLGSSLASLRACSPHGTPASCKRTSRSRTAGRSATCASVHRHPGIGLSRSDAQTDGGQRKTQRQHVDAHPVALRERPKRPDRLCEALGIWPDGSQGRLSTGSTTRTTDGPGRRGIRDSCALLGRSRTAYVATMPTWCTRSTSLVASLAGRWPHEASARTIESYRQLETPSPGVGRSDSAHAVIVERERGSKSEGADRKLFTSCVVT